MKTNKKGFTLIELLAVIVILAVIALIATPIVLGIITKARKSAAQDSAYGMMDALSFAYIRDVVDGKSFTFPLTMTCTETACSYTDSTKDTPITGTVEFKGTKMTDGAITIGEDGLFGESTLKVNGFSCTVAKATQRVTCE